MIRELVSKVATVITERRASNRRTFNVPLKVWIKPHDNGLFLSPYRDLYLSGETFDLSQTGIAFLVSSIRIREDYLVSQDNRFLNIELDLSSKKVRMDVIGRRYERVGIHSTTERYLIGAEIVHMEAEDRRSYEYFLRHGSKLVNALAATAEIEA
jgi:hypothetical protein